MWGGARGIGRNEIRKGLHQIKNFVENHTQTNVIMMREPPHRHDLESKSCVNDAMKECNRKLKKHLKQDDNARVIEVDSDRHLFTRHSLHMNLKGKEHMAKKITRTIKNVLTEGKWDPIEMKDKEDPGKDDEGNTGAATSMKTETGQENSEEEIQPNNETGNIQINSLNSEISTSRTSVRQKKTPKSLSNDFLW